MSEQIIEVGVIGGVRGKMGRAIMELLGQYDEYDAFAIGSDGVNLDRLDMADVAIVAIEPGAFNNPDTTDTLKQHIGEQTDVISIVNGATIEQLCERLGTERVIRTIPNLALAFGQSETGYQIASDRVNREVVEMMLARWGKAMELTDESQFASFTAVGACTIALMARKVRTIERSSEFYGYTHEQAREISLQVLLATYLALSHGEEAADLIKRVATAGGSTAMMMQRLDTCGTDLQDMAAIDDARRRSEELSMQH